MVSFSRVTLAVAAAILIAGVSGHTSFAKGLGIDRAAVERMAVASGLVKAAGFKKSVKDGVTHWRAETDDVKVIEIGFSGPEKDLTEFWVGMNNTSPHANDALKLFGRLVKSAQKDLPKDQPWLARFGKDVYDVVPSWILQALVEFVSAYPVPLSTYVGGRVERARGGNLLVIDGWERGYTRMTLAVDAGKSGFQARNRALAYTLTEPARLAIRAGDFDRAIELLKPLVASGDPGAELFMAEAYHFGRGVEPDPVKAFEMYQRPASLGLARAQTRYALFFSPKVPGTGNIAKQTVPWLLKAAAQGDPWAMRVLSSLLSISAKEQRFVLCEFAARLGSPAGQHCLAGYYQAGVDIDQDFQRAYFWATLGQRIDGPGLRREHFGLIRDDAAQYLSLAQRKTADDLAAKWKPDKIDAIKSDCAKSKCIVPFK